MISIIEGNKIIGKYGAVRVYKCDRFLTSIKGHGTLDITLGATVTELKPIELTDSNVSIAEVIFY